MKKEEYIEKMNEISKVDEMVSAEIEKGLNIINMLLQGLNEQGEPITKLEMKEALKIQKKTYKLISTINAQLLRDQKKLLKECKKINGFYKKDNIIAYQIGWEVVCEKCITDDERKDLGLGEFGSGTVIEDMEMVAFCNRCQKKIN